MPEWLDMERYNKVHDWFKHHALTLSIAWHCSLTVGFTLLPLLDALVRFLPQEAPARSMHPLHPPDSACTAYWAVTVARSQ
jgi:hypothetical protein